MLRMITNSTMNSLLNSAATPPNKCVTKLSALQNGTNKDYMQLFETYNQQSFPLNRLIPVWPIQLSHVETVCVAPYDSRNVRIPIVKGDSQPGWSDAENYCFDRDSYVAGFRYTFEIPSEAQSWLHYYRSEAMAQSINSIGEYPHDKGVYFYADLLPNGVTSRSTYVIVHSEPETTVLYPGTSVSIYEYLYGANGDGVGGTFGPAPSICSSARLFVRQEPAGSGNIVATYTSTSSLQLGFPDGPDPTRTYPNIVVIPDDPTSGLTGIYYTNGEMIDPAGTHSDYADLVYCNANTVMFNFTKLVGTGDVTYDIYGSWEGYDQNSSHSIPFPLRRQSFSVDICPNEDMSVSQSVTIAALGNMNINRSGVIDYVDLTSNVVDKVRARCSLIASVIYNKTTGVAIITKGGSDGRGVTTGIAPIFYPVSYQPTGESATSFVWSSSGASTSRVFNAVQVENKEVTVSVYSKNDSQSVPFYVYMGSDTASDSYIVNGSTITSTDKVLVTSGSFTINLSDSTKYTPNSTHRFRIQQYIEDTDHVLTSGNKSPEYADIAFTIVQGQ